MSTKTRNIASGNGSTVGKCLEIYSDQWQKKHYIKHSYPVQLLMPSSMAAFYRFMTYFIFLAHNMLTPERDHKKVRQGV